MPKMYYNALANVVEEDGKVIGKGGVFSGEGYKLGCYVKPAIAEAQQEFEIVKQFNYLN